MNSGSKRAVLGKIRRKGSAVRAAAKSQARAGVLKSTA
jgi:hypothetical protein